MSGSTEAQVARLDERLNSIEKMIAIALEEIRSASDGRKRMYEGMESTARDLLKISHRLETVENEVKAIRPTSDEYLQMRERVLGAGKLGYWLWRIGGVLLSAAAGFGAAYTYLTGRAPP